MFVRDRLSRRREPRPVGVVVRYEEDLEADTEKLHILSDELGKSHDIDLVEDATGTILIPRQPPPDSSAPATHSYTHTPLPSCPTTRGDILDQHDGFMCLASGEWLGLDASVGLLNTFVSKRFRGTASVRYAVEDYRPYDTKHAKSTGKIAPARAVVCTVHIPDPREGKTSSSAPARAFPSGSVDRDTLSFIGREFPQKKYARASAALRACLWLVEHGFLNTQIDMEVDVRRLLPSRPIPRMSPRLKSMYSKLRRLSATRVAPGEPALIVTHNDMSGRAAPLSVPPEKLDEFYQLVAECWHEPIYFSEEASPVHILFFDLDITIERGSPGIPCSQGSAPRWSSAHTDNLVRPLLQAAAEFFTAGGAALRALSGVPGRPGPIPGLETASVGPLRRVADIIFSYAWCGGEVLECVVAESAFIVMPGACKMGFHVYFPDVYVDAVTHEAVHAAALLRYRRQCPRVGAHVDDSQGTPGFPLPRGKGWASVLDGGTLADPRLRMVGMRKCEACRCSHKERIRRGCNKRAHKVDVDRRYRVSRVIRPVPAETSTVCATAWWKDDVATMRRLRAADAKAPRNTGKGGQALLFRLWYARVALLKRLSLRRTAARTPSGALPDAVTIERTLRESENSFRSWPPRTMSLPMSDSKDVKGELSVKNLSQDTAVAPPLGAPTRAGSTGGFPASDGKAAGDNGDSSVSGTDSGGNDDMLDPVDFDRNIERLRCVLERERRETKGKTEKSGSLFHGMGRGQQSPPVLSSSKIAQCLWEIESLTQFDPYNPPELTNPGGSPAVTGDPLLATNVSGRRNGRCFIRKLSDVEYMLVVPGGNGPAKLSLMDAPQRVALWAQWERSGRESTKSRGSPPDSPSSSVSSGYELEFVSETKTVGATGGAGGGGSNGGATLKRVSVVLPEHSVRRGLSTRVRSGWFQTDRLARRHCCLRVVRELWRAGQVTDAFFPVGYKSKLTAASSATKRGTWYARRLRVEEGMRQGNESRSTESNQPRRPASGDVNEATGAAPALSVSLAVPRWLRSDQSARGVGRMALHVIDMGERRRRAAMHECHFMWGFLTPKRIPCSEIPTLRLRHPGPNGSPFQARIVNAGYYQVNPRLRTLAERFHVAALGMVLNRTNDPGRFSGQKYEYFSAARGEGSPAVECYVVPVRAYVAVSGAFGVDWDTMRRLVDGNGLTAAWGVGSDALVTRAARSVDEMGVGVAQNMTRDTPYAFNLYESLFDKPLPAALRAPTLNTAGGYPGDGDPGSDVYESDEEKDSVAAKCEDEDEDEELGSDDETEQFDPGSPDKKSPSPPRGDEKTTAKAESDLKAKVADIDLLECLAAGEVAVRTVYDGLLYVAARIEVDTSIEDDFPGGRAGYTFRAHFQKKMGRVLRRDTSPLLAARPEFWATDMVNTASHPIRARRVGTLPSGGDSGVGDDAGVPEGPSVSAPALLPPEVCIWYRLNLRSLRAVPSVLWRLEVQLRLRSLARQLRFPFRAMYGRHARWARLARAKARKHGSQEVPVASRAWLRRWSSWAPVLELAVTCKGCDPQRNLEALEFLGDAILEILVVEPLFYDTRRCRSVDDLVAAEERAKNNAALARAAVKCGLSEHIYAARFHPDAWPAPGLGSAADTKAIAKGGAGGSAGGAPVSVAFCKLHKKQLADPVEAVIGAAYLAGTSCRRHYPPPKARHAMEQAAWSVDAGIRAARILAHKRLGLRVPREAELHSARRSFLRGFPPGLFRPGTDQESSGGIPVAELDDLERIIGHKFKRRVLLVQALTTAGSNPGFNYERMEKLGDALCKTLVSIQLHMTPGSATRQPESLHRLRAQMTSNLLFSAAVLRAKIDRSIVRPKSGGGQDIKESYKATEFAESSRDIYGVWVNDSDAGLQAVLPPRLFDAPKPPKVLGDVFEALVAAVFLDGDGDMRRAWTVYARLVDWEENLRRRIETYQQLAPGVFGCS